jgi:hypothetical protein
LHKLIILASACLLVGCASFREPSREAALGMMDALRPPALEDPLLIKLRALLERNVDKALEEGIPETAGDMAGAIVAATFDRIAEEMPSLRGGIEAMVQTTIAATTAALREELGRLRPALRTVAREVTSALVEGMSAGLAKNEAALLQLSEQIAERMGRGLTRGMVSALFDELHARIGDEGAGPMTMALSRATERVAGAAVRGAVGAIAVELPSICPGENRLQCVHDLLFETSRAMAAGATAGFGAQLTPWHLALAVGGGFLMGLLMAWFVVTLTIRRKSEPTTRVVHEDARENPKKA